MRGSARVCSGLKRLTLNTANKKLDLEQLDLGRSRIKDLTPLLSLPKLKTLTGRIDARTAAALRERVADPGRRV